MYTYEVCGFPQRLTISFLCPNCGEELRNDVSIPTPVFSSDKDTFNDTRNDKFFKFECSCGKEYSIQTTGSYNGSYVSIEGIANGYPVTITEGDDYISADLEIVPDKNYYDVFKSGIDEVMKIAEFQGFSKGQRIVVNRLVYIQLVTCVETFLYDALYTSIFEDEGVKKKFVKNYKPFQSEKFKYSDIFQKYESLDAVIKKELITILYHNLGKIKQIYKMALGVDFPEIEELSKIMTIRHSLVHRNGKDDDGNSIEITYDDLKEIYTKIDSFISSIHEKMCRNSNVSNNV